MSRSRRPDPRRPGARWPRVSPAALLLLALAVAGPGLAHDGHAALPSKGATVDGDKLLLSEAAREAIGLELGKVTLEDLCRSVRARTRVALPWSQQALITTLVPGRIATRFASSRISPPSAVHPSATPPTTTPSAAMPNTQLASASQEGPPATVRSGICTSVSQPSPAPARGKAERVAAGKENRRSRTE